MAVAFGQQPQPAPPEFVFGTTVIGSKGFHGKIYALAKDTALLPNLKKRTPVGEVSTNSLNIPTREFRSGFPGVTSRFEWFAIAYDATIWIEHEGEYSFRLLSDDGSRLWIDGKSIIDLDGIHSPTSLTGSAVLTRGTHEVRVEYFQGPAHQVALVLEIATPGAQDFAIFNTDHFVPPDAESLKLKGKIKKVKEGVRW